MAQSKKWSSTSRRSLKSACSQRSCGRFSFRSRITCNLSLKCPYDTHSNSDGGLLPYYSVACFINRLFLPFF